MTPGRSLPSPQFAGDDGSADPKLAAALDAYGSGVGGVGGVAGVVVALAASRVLVPVLAVPGQQSADMALVTLRGADGRNALPAFSSLATLAAWDPTARPVPADARRVALSAVSERADVLVLDAAGPVRCVVPRPAVWAIAQGRAWTPSPQDPEVAATVQACCAAEPAVVAVTCEPGDRAELRVVLTLLPGLDAARVDDLTRRLGRRLAASEIVADRVDSIEMKVISS